MHYDGDRRYEEELTLYPPSPPTADATSVQKAVRCGQSARRMREFVLKYTTYTASYLMTELASGGKGERGGRGQQRGQNAHEGSATERV